jgi:hypothetical protein
MKDDGSKGTLRIWHGWRHCGVRDTWYMVQMRKRAQSAEGEAVYRPDILNIPDSSAHTALQPRCYALCCCARPTRLLLGHGHGHHTSWTTVDDGCHAWTWTHGSGSGSWITMDHGWHSALHIGYWACMTNSMTWASGRTRTS